MSVDREAGEEEEMEYDPDMTQRFEIAFDNPSERLSSREIYRQELRAVEVLEADPDAVSMEELAKKIDYANVLQEGSAMLCREAVYDTQLWESYAKHVHKKAAETHTSREHFSMSAYAERLIKFCAKRPWELADIYAGSDNEGSQGGAGRSTRRGRDAPGTSTQADADSGDAVITKLDFLDPKAWPAVRGGQEPARRGERRRTDPDEPGPSYAVDADASESEEEDGGSITKAGLVTLGRIATVVLRLPTTMIPLYGTFEPDLLPPKPKVVRQQTTRQALSQLKEATVVKAVNADDLSQNKDEMAAEAEHMLKTLKGCCKKNGGSVCYFKFLFDPNSYSQTVRNIFIFSFLFKDLTFAKSTNAQSIRLKLGINTLLMNLCRFRAYVSGKTKEVEKARHSMAGDEEQEQFVLNLCYDTFEGLVKAFGVTEAMYKPQEKG